jgi:SAM-dependent methyltransferase
MIAHREKRKAGFLNDRMGRHTTMNPSDRLHCPQCRGRLSAILAHELRCSDCARTFALVDGIIDFVSGRPPLANDPYGSWTQEGVLGSDLLTRINSAAGSRWGVGFGDAVELACGTGSLTEAILSGEGVRSLLIVDKDMTALRACRGRIADLEVACPVLFAALDGSLAAIRDATVDTVVSSSMLSGIGDARAFLTMVHGMLKTGGRAMFVVPNRRYHQAISMAMAETLTQRYARDGAWPQGFGPVLTFLQETRRLLVLGDLAFRDSSKGKLLFDSDALEDLGKQIGFGSAEVIPLDPDPIGGVTIAHLCRRAGAEDDFAREFGPLAASVGRPYLSLLGHRDSSAYSLLWLSKAIGPTVRIFFDRLVGPTSTKLAPDVAVGGMIPRWSIELVARDTPDGVIVAVGGWCLSNVDTKWVRITLDGVAQQAPVWRHRPDVHEVLNRMGAYHPLNALCSGLGCSLLFADVHPRDEGCTLLVEIVLTGDLNVKGPAPETLLMDEPMVVAY